MSRKTTCKIVIDSSDLQAKEDATLTSEKNVSWADVQNVKNRNNNIKNYLTLELNQGILDGSLYETPTAKEDAGYCLVSAEVIYENEMIVFEDMPYISVSFTEPTTFDGFTFTFKDAFPQEIVMTWFVDELYRMLKFKETDGKIFVCKNKFVDLTNINIYFMKPRFPLSRIKLENMDFGIKTIQDAESISSATILEELNMISSELSINKFNFRLFNKDDEFNLMNPKGVYNSFETGTEVFAYEFLNGEEINMGTFYLDKFQSENAHEISFDCIDAIGRIAKTNFKKGKIYTGETTETVIAEIMTSAGFDKFTIAEELKTIPIYGYIPVCSHREALQQVCFATRSVADCSRSNFINIYRISTTPESRISQNRMFLDGSSIKMKETVSDISITTHKYVKETTASTIFEGNLSAGINEIEFTNPTTDLVVTGATIIDSGLNFVKVNVPSYQNVLISGKIYNDTKNVYNKSYDGLKNNTLKISNATLVTEENINLVLEHVFNYYGLRKEADQEFILESEKVGKWYNLASQLGFIVSGGVESQQIDLINGFLSSASVVGYNSYNSDFSYTGTEIHTGESIGVL